MNEKNSVNQSQKHSSGQAELSPRPAQQRDAYPTLDDVPRGFTEAEWIQIVNANHAWLKNRA